MICPEDEVGAEQPEQDVTAAESSSTEVMKRVQWPPSAGGNIIDDAVDGQPNVEQSNTNQPDDAVQDETIQPADEQLNQVAQETQKEPCDPIQVQVEADEKLEQAEIEDELPVEISFPSTPNQSLGESQMPKMGRRASRVDILAFPACVPSPLKSSPMKAVERKSSRPAIPGLVLSPPMKAVPYSQPSRPVISSHPVFKRSTPGRTLGVTVWPPRQLEPVDFKLKCEEPTPAKRQQIDADSFFSVYRQPARLPMYRPPPGTQRIRKHNDTQAVGKSVPQQLEPET